MWEIIDTGRDLAANNMLKDKELLDQAASFRSAILHLYDWEGDSATYGHFIKPQNYIELGAAKQLGLNLARRPTGGGIVWHTCDLAFSVVIPSHHKLFSTNTLDNYQTINSQVLAAVKKFVKTEPSLLAADPTATELSRNFCMAKPTIYDVMLGGKKIGGAAQRRTKEGLLHQGTISIARPPSDYLAKLVHPEVHQAMMQNSFTLLPDGWSERELHILRQQIREELINRLTM